MWLKLLAIASFFLCSLDKLRPVMYCTGGIRCEMASAYIRSEGARFENVFQSAPRAWKTVFGYYVMRYMIEIITRSDLKRTVNEHFNDMMPHSQEDIDEVRGLWADYFLNN